MTRTEGGQAGQGTAAPAPRGRPVIFGDFMMGARNRLLPSSVPFRFFAAAVVFQIAAWGLLAVFAGDLPGFLGGPGEMLAALHLVTLGVVAMTAMGAALQILPVATKVPVRSVAACKLVFWLFLPGVLLLTHGMGHQQSWAMQAGGGLALCAMLLFAAIVADVLRQVADMRVVTEHAWVAVVSLVTLSGLGLALVSDFDLGFLPDHAAFAAVHGVIAAYGFMGMLALGVSFLLIPLFGQAKPPDTWLGRQAGALVTLGLVAGSAGLLADRLPLVLAGGALGLAGLLVHLWAMAKVMRSRMKKDLGDSFVLVRLGWTLPPLSLMIGLAAAAGLAVDRAGPLFGFVLVFGWLLSFVTGVLQRIMPFLASLHTVRPGMKPILVSGLTAGRPLKIHMLCHLAALVLVAAGIVGQNVPAIRAGAVLGLIGAVAFALFAGRLGQKLWQHLKTVPQPAEKG